MPLTHVEVAPATREQAPIIANLFELYAHDFSEFFNIRIGPDGRFGYAPLPLYWQEPHRYPFLIRADGELAGFVLVQQGSRISGAVETWDVAEFFVLRGWRRRGVGLRAACQVWQRFAGPWEVRVQESNTKARLFWQRAVEEYTGMPAHFSLAEVAGKQWHVLSFVSRAGG